METDEQQAAENARASQASSKPILVERRRGILCFVYILVIEKQAINPKPCSHGVRFVTFYIFSVLHTALHIGRVGGFTRSRTLDRLHLATGLCGLCVLLFGSSTTIRFAMQVCTFAPRQDWGTVNAAFLVSILLSSCLAFVERSFSAVV